MPAIQDAPGHDARRRDAPERAVDVALRDGSTLHVRPVRERDATAMRAFFDALSVESIGLRFFGIPNVQWVTKWAVDVEQGDRYALVATTGPRQEIVAHGAYVRARSGEHAEVAGQKGCRAHSPGDRFAVEKLPEFGFGFHGVPEGMAEVEDAAQTRFALVGGNDFRLDAYGLANDAVDYVRLLCHHIAAALVQQAK